jgi:hypothetical protein
MTQLSSNRIARLGRVFPEKQLSAEEKAKRRAQDEAFAQRCMVIFERIKPELIEEHYDWFMFIEPNSGDYFFNPDEIVVRQKAKEKHPHSKCLIVRINETGSCGRI